ncbi:MAG: hypothetical protein V3V99_12280 [candidate division Zixibacteria bacterium]
MDWGTYLWTTLGVCLTLSTFSFLYRDNPFYKFSESLFVGVSAGYFSMLLVYNNLIPNLFDKIWVGQPWWQIWGGQWWYIFPGILGLLMWFRFSKKKAWISRYPIAFYIGIATGVAIPTEMQNRVSRQLADTVNIVFDIKTHFAQGFWVGFEDVVIILGVVTGLFYFFFSVAHKGTFGGVAKFGIYILMIGFGASFGYTVMARISLFIQRVQYIRDWVSAGFEGGGGMTTVVWVTTLILVLLIILEIIRHMQKKSSQAPA